MCLGDATSRALVHSIDLGNSVEAQQVGIVWASEDALVSLSLGGALNLLNPQEGKITMEIHVSRWPSFMGPLFSCPTHNLFRAPPNPSLRLFCLTRLM
jgi:hypothetical protein